MIMPDPILSIQNLQIDFINEKKRSTAVKDISIDVNRGETLAIVGESGSGKSVTALSILQLLPKPPAQYVNGQIFFTDKTGNRSDLLTASAGYLQHTRGNEISMIFQEPMTSLNPVHTCGSQVMEAILLHQRVNPEEAAKRTISLFEKVKLPHPAAIFHRYPHQLSGGQKQRVMIAMAMSCSPSLLICDEPTTALDVTVQKAILQLIKELQQQQNMTVIFITHDLGVVAEIADRVVVMYKGRIVEQGPAGKIYNQPKHPYTKALLACRPILHPKGEPLPIVSDFMEVDEYGQIREKQPLQDGIPKINTAQTIKQPGQPVSTPQPILKVEQLKVWFPVKKGLFRPAKEFIKAVDDVSFEVFEGEILGLVGESGCGKTTLGRAILRLINPTGGSIFFRDQDLVKASPDELRRLRKDMQIVFQDPYSSLNPRLTVGAAIAEPLKVHHVEKNDRERKELVMDLLQKVNLAAEIYNRYPHEFSGGQRQRIVIARALALKPSFVICDESVSALDVSVQAQVLNLLNDLKKQFGFTVIFISHDLSVVRYISDRIMVMNKGTIEETGDAEAIYHYPKSSYTQGLIASIPKAPNIL